MDQRKGDWLEHGGSEEADCDMSEVDREKEGRGREGNPGVPVSTVFCWRPKNSRERKDANPEVAKKEDAIEVER